MWAFSKQAPVGRSRYYDSPKNNCIRVSTKSYYYVSNNHFIELNQSLIIQRKIKTNHIFGFNCIPAQFQLQNIQFSLLIKKHVVFTNQTFNSVQLIYSAVSQTASPCPVSVKFTFVTKCRHLTKADIRSWS